MPKHHNRKYEVDESFFEKIDSLEKAYWLGWFASDGHINKSKNYIVIKLQAGDSKMLDILKSLIKSNHIITIRKYNKLKYPNWQDSHSLQINSTKIAKDIYNLGYDHNKTQTGDFPYFIDNSIISHFARGFFEGNGCISFLFDKRCPISKSYTIKISASHKVCLGFQMVFNSFDWASTISKSKGCSMIRISNKKNCLCFLNWIYKDCGEMKLDRKYNKYLELKREVEEYFNNKQ